ncbi:hypothetical protein [Rhizobium lusitanum]|uniref:DUF680 domain-containing protein n=1 Tax=Rhizobium lusitanum TaxID=293958 RepID=A0A7X0IRB9_9HYPH|nr:hypothetical protein [Rhizobium lusitanum]MBB6485429.1 hypothetical protein [Rhizobium lusitanum]
MLLKTLAISALVIGMSSAAMAEQVHKHRHKNLKVETIQTDVGNVDHSKDAILPDGRINTDPSVTGPIRAGDSMSRLQCAAAPNAVGVRSTYAAGPSSLCP